MLKEGGTLVIDFNDGKSQEEHVRRVSALDTLLFKYCIPLSAQVVITTEKNRRNDLSGSSLFVCTKYMEFSPAQDFSAEDLILIGRAFENMLSSGSCSGITTQPFFPYKLGQ